MVVSACSTQKNTAKSRWWHSFNAKYNTYYNGKQSYIEASLAKENGNKDNFTEIIPLYTVGNKQSRQIGSSQYDKAIEKAQKAIKQHSIRKRPEWTKSRKKTERDIEWLNRREYNPFIWKAWMLMGRSQFYKGNFDEAAATFSYMSRMYQTQPAIYGKARAWLAKCYIEQDWLYDAEDVIRNMSRDSIDWRAQKEWDYTYADYYIHSGEYEKAVPYLRKVIKHEMRKKQKAREWYLMGQLQSALGNRQEAYNAYKHVIRQNPPYETEFNARIAMSEVMAESGQTRQVISRLKRMAASDKNKDYLDQVYYAIGNIYLTQHDTINAIAAYEKGNEKATRSGIEKGVLLLKLGDLYWAKEKFGDARRCYGTAIGLLDRDRKDYKQLSQRSVILDELVPFTDAIHLQDSLQTLAKMDEKDRNAAIDKVIEELIKKEKEEKHKQQEQEAAKTQQQNGGGDLSGAFGNAGNMNNNKMGGREGPRTNQLGGQLSGNMSNAAGSDGGGRDGGTTDNGLGGGAWYFYNPTAVSQGKLAFQRQWGKRENTDDWQRANKTVVGGDFSKEMEEMSEEMRDSLNRAEAMQDSIAKAKENDPSLDPHKREYYLAQIPFTEEQVAASNDIITDGLHHSGVIFKDKLDNLRLSEKQLRRLTDSYPDYKQMDDVYYHLFLLYSRKGQTAIADEYVRLLSEKFPESKWTTVLTDPYFRENAQFGEQLEDSLYAATYEAFKADRYSEVAGNAHISETRFPLGANRDKFIFINGLSKLNQGDADECVKAMNEVVKNYPKSRISEMAGMIVNGVKAGRRLHGGKFDLGDVWSRRTAVLNDSDSLAARQFIDDRNANFIFMLAYSPDSLNENQLLFEMARFNFSSFMVRNFDLTITDADGLHLMQVSGFRNFDEAHQYAGQVYANEAVVRRINNQARAIIISEPNLELLGTLFSYDDYDAFYAEHFAPLKVSSRYLLAEPDEIDAPEPKLNPLPDQFERQNTQTDNTSQKGQEGEDTDGTEMEGTDINNNTDVFDNFDVDDDTTPTPTETLIDEPNEPNRSNVPTQPTETVIDEPNEPNRRNVPNVPADPIETVIDEPDEPTRTNVPADPTETVIDEPDEPARTNVPNVPADPTETVIDEPDEPVRPNVPADPMETVIDEPDEPNEPNRVNEPKKPVEPEPTENIIDEPNTPDEPTDDDDFDVIFDDFDAPSNTPGNNNNNDPSGYDVEDEYYELDGF
ncbi:MAG: tetratricopeptide repeat protein [Prevotella sp.]|nr:tetratricopeptide repeat protein [Prevotella sp.]